MESNKYCEFTIMVMFPEHLRRKIEDYNSKHHTNFEIVEIIDDEVEFCKIRVSKYSPADIFNLGYGLAAMQYSMKIKGEIDWQ